MGDKVQDLREEMNRRQSTRARMLRAFKENHELTTRDLNKFGTGCSSRLFELRKEGHVIVSTYQSPGNYRYTYLGNKTED